MSMHRTSPLTFTSCAHTAADKSFPNGTSVCDFGPRYKRALTAIQVISMVPERVKCPLTLIARKVKKSKMKVTDVIRFMREQMTRRASYWIWT